MPGNWDGKSRPSNDSYRKNFDEIFKEKRKSCPCGRSPIPRCIGWHALTERDYQEQLKKWHENNNV